MSTDLTYSNLKPILKFILRSLFSSDSSFSKVIIGITYVIIYDILYRDFVVELFSYMGLEYIQMAPWKFIAWLTISVFPFVFYKGVYSISALISLLIYLFAYIPMVHALFITYGVNDITSISYSIILAIFFTLYFTIPIQPKIFREVQIKPSLRFSFVEFLAVFITLIVIAFRFRSMHVVNIFTESELMYSFREDNSETATGFMKIIEYLKGWLISAFYPYLLAHYLEKRKTVFCITVLVGYFLMFMVDMQKMTLLMPLPMIALYYLVNRHSRIFDRYTHSIIMLSITGISLVFLLNSDDETMFAIAALIILRTVCVAGWLTQMYLHFFSHNAFTSYGHITPVNAIFHNYPYGSEPLGKVVSYGAQNANANLFLTDGYAAAGLIGIILISLFFLFFLHFLDSLTRRQSIACALIIIFPSIAALLNSSIFTLFLSNGLFIIILLMIMNSINHKETPDSIID